MKISAVVLLILAEQAAASKKSKAGSTLQVESLSSCPDLSGSSKKSGGGKQSKGCGSGGTTTVSCGDSFYNEKVYLLKDLVCDSGEDTISLRGQHAVLDCGGRSIVGYGEPDDNDVILELRDGASVVNCNFAEGYHAIETLGDGCSTIENVSVYDSEDDSIRISHSGGVVIKDVSIFSPGDDGIETRIDDGDDLHAIFENLRVLDAEDDSIDFACEDCDDSDCGGDIVVDFYGNVFLWNSDEDNMDMEGVADIDLTVYGNLFVYGATSADGIDVNEGSSVTFAAGSFSELCENDDDGGDYDLEYGGGRVDVEDGAMVICNLEFPDNNNCKASCEVDEAIACVV